MWDLISGAISSAVTAIATGFIAWFTYTIWRVNQSQLQHARTVERAYISGGGPTGPVDGIRVFVLTAENTGKTPATLTDYSIFLRDRSELPAEPEYLDPRHTPIVYIARIPPDHRTREVTRRPIPDGPNPIAYGRFRYTDIWDKPHSFSFILPLNAADNHTIVGNLSPAYTAWD
jgi:hypothetical protein